MLLCCAIWEALFFPLFPFCVRLLNCRLQMKDMEDIEVEEGAKAWVEKTRQQAADAVPHDDAWWNCAVCGKQCLGTRYKQTHRRSAR